MSWSGWATARGDSAAGAALSHGATPLEALVIGDSASYPETCFLKDAVQAGHIVQANGRHPHPRSVARARRNAACKGLLTYVRVMPGHRPPNARWTTTPGTTAKVVDFTSLGCRDPLSRADRRRAHSRRLVIEKALKKAASSTKPLAQELRDKPRHSAPVPAPVSLDSTLASVIAETTANLERLWARREEAEDQAMMASVEASMVVRRPPKPPPRT